MALEVKNMPVNAGDIRDAGSNPKLGRSPREGNGSPLQYSCLKNPMDRRAWRAIVHRLTKSQTRLKWLSMQHTWFSMCTHVAQIMNSSFLNSDWNWKVGKATRPFRYDLNQIPYDYTVEVRNRSQRLDLIDWVPEELWTEVHDIVQETVI